MGQIRNTWQRGILENGICTCNAPFAECPFWRSVVERLPFAAEPQAEALRSPFPRGRASPAWFSVPGHGNESGGLTAFAAPTEALYAAAGGVAGVRQLVDSSKSSLYAAFLHGLPTIDLRVVHLVRDPRATVYSHLRRYSFGYGEAFKLSLWWLRSNAAIEKLGRTGVPYTRIRYEDFVEDPAGSLGHIVDALGLPVRGCRLREKVARLSKKHIISGESRKRRSWSHHASQRLRVEVWASSSDAGDRAWHDVAAARPLRLQRKLMHLHDRS